MHTYFINKNGVQTYIDSRGIYLSYPIDSSNIAEVSLDSSIRALRLFQVASLQDITGFHIMAYNY
jgi:hypothetical protein|tara:strand:+ start:288 stop:482 length:195 start_codon:yes stop_codon:yes gene_type:complete